MNILYWNANGVRNKTQELLQFLQDYNIDVALINETHTKPSHDLQIQNYRTYRTDRPNRPGGGTAILIRNRLKHVQTEHPDTDTIEHTDIIVRTKGQDIRLSAIYTPPHIKLDKRDLDRLLQYNTPTLIAGDLNSKHRDWNCPNTNINGRTISKYLENHTDVTIMTPIEPTHYPPTGLPNIIDIALTRNIKKYTTITTLQELSSDHNPVIITIYDSPPIDTPPPIKTDWTRLTYELQRTDITIPIITNSRQIDLAVNHLTKRLTETLESCQFPRREQKQTLPIHIQNLIRQKNKLRKTYQNTLYPPHKTTLNNLQRQIKQVLKDYRNEQWHKKLTNLNAQDNTLWKVSKILRTDKRKIPPLSTPKTICYSEEDKAEAFADSMEEQFTNNYQNMDIDLAEHVDRTVHKYLKRNDDMTPTITHFDPTEIRNTIRDMPTNKAPGHDKIPAKLLTLLPDKYILYLTAIYNAIQRHHYYPNNWKHAIVTMIPKPHKDNKFPNNYRPISVLPALSKILERLLLDRLTQHIDKNKIIPQEQFGFRQGHDTTMQLLRLTEYIKTAFTWKQTATALFLDIEKAFDRVWHNGLIYKLIMTDVPTYLTKTMTSFIKNRTFQIKINNTLSTTRTVKAGVPQGSALSPTLYNVYTYDIPTNDNGLLAIYADDTVIVTKSRSPDLAMTKLQDYTDELTDYFNKWRIKLNADKTVNILFSTNPSVATRHDIVINNRTVPKHKETTYLGITLDQRLKYHTHATNILGRARTVTNRLFPLIGRTSTMTVKNKLLLYKTTIEPIMTYAAPIWNTVANTHKHRLQTLQNKIIRATVNAYRYTPNRVLYRDLNITPLIDIYETMTEKTIQQATYHKNDLVRKAIDYDPELNPRIKRLKTGDKTTRPP